MPSLLPSFEDRLSLARERLGIALTPADRAARGGTEPGYSLDRAQVFSAPDPLQTPEAPSSVAMIGGRDYSGRGGELQGYGSSARPATEDMTNAYLERSMSATAQDPGAAPQAAPMSMAPRMPSMELAQSRGVIPQGGVIGDPSRQGVEGGTTMLPVGNLRARDAILRSQFPNAGRRDLQSLGAMASYRPNTFNALMAGTRLDPAMASERSAQHAASLQSTLTSTAATAQGMQLSAAEAQRRAIGEQRKVQQDQAAAQAYVNHADPEIANLANSGASFEQIRQFEDNKRQAAEYQMRADEAAARSQAGFPTASDALQSVPAGSTAQISQTGHGRYIAQFQTPAPKEYKPSTELEKLHMARDRAIAQGRDDNLKDINARIDLLKTRPESAGKQALDAAERMANPAGKPATAPAAVVAPSQAPQAPSAFASYEGKQLRGPDGNIYVVQNGKPILKK